MEKRIELEKRGRPAEEIKELNLDNCRATQIEGLTEEFKILASLSLINVGLTTLKGFPSLPNLRKLELSDNRISGSLNLLSGCPKLEYLNLSGNKIKDIATLEPLKNFKCVLTLDLFNCEVTNVESYREKVFELLEGLQYLDGFDRNNQEAEDEEEDGEDVDGEDDDDDEEDDDDDDDEVVCVLSDDEEEDGIVEVDEECDDEEGDDDDEADDDDDEEDDEEVGLDYLEKENLDDESEGEEFAPGDGHEEEDVDEDGADADAAARGVKRKHDEEEEDS